MAIVCGTDFSKMSSNAVTAAAHLARRMKTGLQLVHCLDVGTEEIFDEPRAALVQWAEARLRAEADRVRPIVPEVLVTLKAGPPDEALLSAAQETSAHLVVVGALGKRKAGKWQLGSHADRIAQKSRIPVLVVRDAQPFVAWSANDRPLRLAVGIDRSVSSDVAAAWAANFTAPRELVAMHLYWPPDQYKRLGLGGLRNFVDHDPEVGRVLERDIRGRFAKLPGPGPVKLRLEPHMGRLADRLVEVAGEEGADVLVVGSHERDLLARIWEGSVSRGILHCAQTSVVLVPSPRAQRVRATPRARSILVATDFSAPGNAAIPLAYSMIPRGGVVHVVHVLKARHDALNPRDIFTMAPGGRADEVDITRKRLTELIPADAELLGKGTEIHVLDAHQPAAAICQAAERLGVDAICMGIHGTSSVEQVLLGSVTQAVLLEASRPVLVTRGPRP